MRNLLRPSARRSDEGFSVVEISIALAVFAVIATLISQMLATGMTGVLLGKRREVATQEANRMLEIARSLGYDAVGLIDTDSTIASDSAIQTQDGVQSYLSDDTWEPIVFVPGTAGHPFNPHSSAVDRGATSLTRFVYVTAVDADADGVNDMKRVAVRITWSESDSTGARNEVRAQTLISEAGAIPLPGTASTTPVTAATSAEGPRVAIKSARGSVLGLLDAVLPSDPVTMRFPSTTGESAFRAVSDVNCSAKSTSLSGAVNYGGQSVTATADDDAASTTPSDAEQEYTANPPVSVTGIEDAGDLLSQVAFASPVSCLATANDTDGALPTDDGLAYEKGTGEAMAQLNLIEDLTGLALPTNQLDAYTVSTLPVTQQIDHQHVAGEREVYAAANAAFGTVDILKIPSVFASGLVNIDGLSYGVSVRGSSNTPSAAPAITAPNITLKVYDVASEVSGCSSRTGNYCVVTVNPTAAGFTGRTIEFEHNVLQNAGLTNLRYEIRVDILPPAKDPVDGVEGPNGERRWSAEYTPISVSARLRAELTVNPLLGLKVLLTDTLVDASFGAVSAKACSGVAC